MSNESKGVVNVKRREVYGVEKFYPIGCNAFIFAKLAGTKTLTPQAIEAIKELGYTVEVG